MRADRAPPPRQIDAVRALLASRDSILSAYNRATNQRDGLELQLQQLQSNPKARPEKVDKLKEQLEEVRGAARGRRVRGFEAPSPCPTRAQASAAVDAMLLKVNRATKGVLLVELPRAEQEFSQEMRSATGQFAAVHLASNQRVRTLQAPAGPAPRADSSANTPPHLTHPRQLRQAWQRLIADLGFELSTLAPNTRESLESGAIVKTSGSNPFAREHPDAGAATATAAVPTSAGAAGASADEGDRTGTEEATRAMEDVEL